ncbi:MULTISPECIES: carbohydrate ABC transporter permease [Bacillus]|uniref:Sugar ABC transporter permease n=1 Tax=Bacillus infantis TaxID=324767 RepID=A0A5D4SHY9_9BACI|nr:MULTISPECIES: sugar ABC transporter permease [Bacillus]OXT17261.1 spermidine/putrescine ABC transporter permease [Bacillus sp. OG2]MDT0159680.1 sugar ABC transporter permease [Bacillus sp. AG4(2022)]PLR71607.1 sugar ABC transporter permease [Bacillus sp. UMB0728]RYI32400.1 sugar ABC transporter permease [Bacillus infantis]TYS62889.1 sugar ABC transporter permease [Bacillus infantis]
MKSYDSTIAQNEANSMGKEKAKSEPKRLSRKAKDNLFGYLFISPWIIGFLGLTLGPLLFSLFASFTDYNITSRMNFIGLDNFKRMFTIDDLFKTSLWNTIYYVLFSVPLTTAGAILLAVLLNQRVKGMKFFRTVYYLPAILSGVAVYFLWMQLLSPSTGLVNTFLAWFGIEGPAWLFDPEWTKPALLLMKMWSVGGGMLLYLASLQGVSAQMYEAADLDGASSFQKFFHITLPMISPIIFFDVITSTIGSFQIFQEAYVMTENGDGGPGNSLLFYNLHMWNNAFEIFDMGYASAMAWLLFLIVMVLTVINLTLGKKWVHYEGGDNK